MPIDLSTNQIIDQNKLITDNIELLLIEFVYARELPVRICLNNTEINWNSVTWYPAVFSITGINETKDAEIPKIVINFFDLNRIVIPILEETNGLPGTIINIYVVDSKYLDEVKPKIHERAFIDAISFNENALVTIEVGTENLSMLRVPKNRYLKNHCRFKFKESVVQFHEGKHNFLKKGAYIKGSTSNSKGIVRNIRIDQLPDTDHMGGYMDVFLYSTPFTNSEQIDSYEDSEFNSLEQTGIATVVQSVTRCGYTGAETECDRTYFRCEELGNHQRFGGFPGIGTYGLFK